MLAPEKGEQRKGVRRVVQSAGKGRGRAASLCLSYFFASNRLTRPFGYAPLADSATVGAPFGVVGVLSGFMALSGLIFGWVGVSGAILSLNLNSRFDNKHTRSCLAIRFWVGGLWHKAMAEPQSGKHTHIKEAPSTWEGKK